MRYPSQYPDNNEHLEDAPPRLNGSFPQARNGIDPSEIGQKSTIPIKKSNPAISVMKKTARFALQVLDETPVEIVLGAIVGGTLAFGGIYAHQTKLYNTIPLAFSEISQIERDAQEKGTFVGPFTETYAKCNDLTMKIFEARNKANNQTVGDKTLAFAMNLKEINDPSNRKFHYNLADFVEQVPQTAAIAIESFKPHLMFRNKIGPLESGFSASWTEKHVDNYHTEWYTETVTDTDSEGNTTSHTELRSREVYDDTDHWYWFHPQHASPAVQQANEIAQNTPHIPFPEQLLKASKTHKEGEQAAKESRAARGEDVEKLSRKEYLRIAHTWANGSTIAENIPRAGSATISFKTETSDVSGAVRTAHDVHYKTYSSSDAGPREYQAFREMVGNIQGSVRSIDGIFDATQSIKTRVPTLGKTINTFISAATDVESSSKNPVSKKELDLMSEKVFKETQQLYMAAFKKGVDVQGFNGWTMAAWTFGGLMLGGLLGSGANALGESTGAYRSLLRRIPEDSVWTRQYRF